MRDSPVVTPVKTGVQQRAVLRGERVLLTMDMVKLDSGFRRNDGAAYGNGKFFYPSLRGSDSDEAIQSC